MVINTQNETSTMNISKYRQRLQEESKNTHICKAHAAAVFYKGQAVAYGHNSILGKHASHAEFAALRAFMIARGLIGWVRESRTLWGSHSQYEKGSKRFATIT